MLKTEYTLIDSDRVQARWMRVDDAIRYSTIPRTTLYQLINDGTLRTANLKRKGNKHGIRLIEIASLDEYIAKQTSGGSKGPGARSQIKQRAKQEVSV